MRPMPSVSVNPAYGGGRDELADWIEDFVLDTVLAAVPSGNVVGVGAERHEDYYEVTIFTGASASPTDMDASVEQIENELSARGLHVVVDAQLSAVA